jgi:hypothetical protein
LAPHIKGETQNEGVEDKVLRKVFVPKGDEVTGDWRRLLSDELYDLYSSSNISRVTESRE